MHDMSVCQRFGPLDQDYCDKKGDELDSPQDPEDMSFTTYGGYIRF